MAPKTKHTLPLTGAQLTLMPHYRLLRSMIGREPTTEDERHEEMRLWRSAFCEDYRLNIAVTQMHVHQPTCFKYVVQQSKKKAKHCRFGRAGKRKYFERARSCFLDEAYKQQLA